MTVTHYHDRLCERRSCDGLPLDSSNLPVPSGQTPSCNACLALLGEDAPPLIGLTFGEALDALKNRRRVRRRGWNGKGMWVVLIHAGNAMFTAFGEALPMQNCFGMRTATGKMQPGWLASQADMLATDWEIVPEWP